jgi:hypothetical protein
VELEGPLARITVSLKGFLDDGRKGVTPAAVTTSRGFSSKPSRRGADDEQRLSLPTARRLQATAILREEFQRLVDLALDVVDRIVSILDAADGDADFEPDADAEPSFGEPELDESQMICLRGGSRDLEEG